MQNVLSLEDAIKSLVRRKQFSLTVPFIGLAAGPQSMRHAISDWEDDLQFLKTKYYEGHGLQFRP